MTQNRNVIIIFFRRITGIYKAQFYMNNGYVFICAPGHMYGGIFVLCYRGIRLVNEKFPLRPFGIKDGDQVAAMFWCKV